MPPGSNGKSYLHCQVEFCRQIWKIFTAINSLNCSSRTDSCTDEIICDQLRIFLQISLNPHRWLECEKRRLFFLKQKRTKQRIFPFSSLGSWCVIVSRTKWWRGGRSMGSWAVKVRHREMALAQGHNWLGREPACTDTQIGMCMCRERQKCGSRWLLKENCRLVRQFIVIKEKWSFSDPLRGPVALLLLSLSTLFHHFLQHWDINGVIISQPSLSDVSSTWARDNQSLNNFWNSQMDPRFWFHKWFTLRCTNLRWNPKSCYHCFGNISPICTFVYSVLHNNRAPTVKAMSWIVMIASMPQKRAVMGEGEEEEIRSKGTALDAYHQRELNSCNRSKKHPWVVKSRRVGGWKQQKATKNKDAYVVGGRGRCSNQTIHRHWFNVTAANGCKWENSLSFIGKDAKTALFGLHKLICCQDLD